MFQEAVKSLTPNLKTFLELGKNSAPVQTALPPSLFSSPAVCRLRPAPKRRAIVQPPCPGLQAKPSVLLCSLSFRSSDERFDIRAHKKEGGCDLGLPTWLCWVFTIDHPTGAVVMMLRHGSQWDGLAFDAAFGKGGVFPIFSEETTISCLDIKNDNKEAVR
ncbi:hypothetical protein N431DRAFT_30238 [Stipitochalara longipes BDJ]|nr:hypothetical protein N431DRAFT_30238 [Stipitochalara longipes BDJ]